MKSLRNKKYRDAFVRSQINVGIPFQVRALREKRGWNQTQLAEASGMLQPRISTIERPGGSKLNLETLLRLATAFDVGLVVKFAPFSAILRWSQDFSPDTFEVPSFEQDIALESGDLISPLTSSRAVEMSSIAFYREFTGAQGILEPNIQSGTFSEQYQIAVAVANVIYTQEVTQEVINAETGEAITDHPGILGESGERVERTSSA